MEAVDRDELIGLLIEALMRDTAFRPRRGAIGRPTRSNAAPRPRYAPLGLVEHLYRCGIRWSRLPPHRTWPGADPSTTW